MLPTQRKPSQFIGGWLLTRSGQVAAVKGDWGWPEYWGAVSVRLGIGRDRYRVDPGLYAMGDPGPDSPVLVTANYKLTFDHLRRAIRGKTAWILVLDTKGVNVWCAAGKGTFATSELVRRMHQVGLEKIVSHRVVIVPQLGAAGVAAHEVKAATGFRVVFGPVRACDVPAFLDAGMRATPAMRTVDFPMRDRFVVALVEWSRNLTTMGCVLAALFVVGGLGAGFFSLERGWHGAFFGFVAYLCGFVAGNIVTPLLLPWLPGRALSLKGAVAGAVAGLGVVSLASGPAMGAGLWLGAVATSSWYGMQFTGATTYTSPSGVEREMRRALPVQTATAVVAVVLWRLGLGWEVP